MILKKTLNLSASLFPLRPSVPLRFLNHQFLTVFDMTTVRHTQMNGCLCLFAFPVRYYAVCKHFDNMKLSRNCSSCLQCSKKIVFLYGIEEMIAVT